MRIMCERVGIYRRNNKSSNNQEKSTATGHVVLANNRVNGRRCRCIAEEAEAVEAILGGVVVSVCASDHPPRVGAVGQVRQWFQDALLDAHVQRTNLRPDSCDHGQFLIPTSEVSQVTF